MAGALVFVEQLPLSGGGEDDGILVKCRSKVGGGGIEVLEAPQLVTGDTTVIQPGMVLAVDGSVSVETFRAQVGDSFIITEDGWEPLTHHPKSVEEVIL